MNEAIERIDNAKGLIEANLASYLGNAVSRMELRELTELYNIIDDLLDETTQFFELTKERLKAKLESENNSD